MWSFEDLEAAVWQLSPLGEKIKKDLLEQAELIQIDKEIAQLEKDEEELQAQKAILLRSKIDINLSYRKPGQLVILFPTEEDAETALKIINRRSDDAKSLSHMVINKNNPKELVCALQLAKNGELKMDLGNHPAVLHFFDLLGIKPIKKLGYPIKYKAYQIGYEYENGIISYDAPTPHTLPEEEKRSFDQFYQRNRVYFQRTSPIFSTTGLTLSIPVPHEARPLSVPFSRGMPEWMEGIEEDPPSWSLWSETKIDLPTVTFSQESTELLAIHFSSAEEARLAFLLMGEGTLLADAQKQFTKKLNKLFLKDGQFCVPVINPKNPQQMLVPVVKDHNDNYHAYLGNRTALIDFFKLLEPAFSETSDLSTLCTKVQPDLKTNTLVIKTTSHIFAKPNKQLKVILPYNSPLILSEENKAFLTLATKVNLSAKNAKFAKRYFAVANKMKLAQSTRHNLENLLAFAESKKIDLEKEAQKTHLVIPAHIKTFLQGFLDYKKESTRGTRQEDIYREMSLHDFIARLVGLRPAVFWLPSDEYILWDGTKGSDYNNSYKNIDPHLVLQYDELPVAALLISSSQTHFINKGDMHGQDGRPGSAGTYQEEGICMSVVGTRLEKRGAAEYPHVIITPEQNQPINGFGKDAKLDLPQTKLNKLWANLYGLDHFPSYAEVLAEKKASKKYLDIGNGHFFNLDVYTKRTYLLVEAYLLEINERAKADNKSAYVDAMGFGTGVWSFDAIKSVQESLLPMIYELVLKNHKLDHISDIHFSHLKHNKIKECGGAKDGEKLKVNGNKVTVRFSDRSPNGCLEREHKEKLLGRLYQGDPNSWGNEYWGGHLSASGEPVAYASSFLPFYQVPKLNADLVPDLKRGNRIHDRGTESLPAIDSILHARDWQALVQMPEQKATLSTAVMLTSMPPKPKPNVEFPLPTIQPPPVSEPPIFSKKEEDQALDSIPFVMMR